MLYMRSKNSAKNRYCGRFESEVYIYDWTTISMPAKPKKNKQSMTSTNKYVLFPSVFVSQIKVKNVEKLIHENVTDKNIWKYISLYAGKKW